MKWKPNNQKPKHEEFILVEMRDGVFDVGEMYTRAGELFFEPRGAPWERNIKWLDVTRWISLSELAQIGTANEVS